RKYGVATVWLVATLGSKSTLKRVSRKAILDVDVAKACDTIGQPQAPMALRLQSNLLYGVARVYSQQCGYVLSDAEAAKHSRGRDQGAASLLFRGVLATGGADRSDRAEQLLLQDDPNFLPDFDLVPLDLDQLNFDFNVTSIAGDDSQHSTLSPHNSQSFASQQSLPVLNFPARSSSLVGGPVGGGGSFGVRGDLGSGVRHHELYLDDDLSITVEADGTMRFSEGPINHFAAQSARADGVDLELTDSGVKPGHGSADGIQDQAFDDLVLLQGDDIAAPRGFGAFPTRNVAEDAKQPATSSETVMVEAPARRRHKPAPKVMVPDGAMELRNGDLAQWNTNYVINMHEALQSKASSRSIAVAKENARHWVLGTGGLGTSAQSDMLLTIGPLAMFSGANVLEVLTGFELLGVGGEKRSRAANDEGDHGRQKRRLDEPLPDSNRGLGSAEHQLYDYGYLAVDGDDYTAVEQGREAPTPLDDRHLSSVFPWNQSTGSRRPTGIFTSASVPTAVGLTGRASRGESRLQSASPLVGRGLLIGHADSRTHGPIDDGLSSDRPAVAGINYDDVAMSGLNDLDDFELFGPAAQVDTQTAAQSQWQRAALETESGNFLVFVQAAIAEMDGVRDEAVPGGDEDEALRGSVDFEDILSPRTNTRVVAAQGLLHVLALGTKGLLNVEQAAPFTDIRMRAVAV
ncbi:R8 protein, partial [Teratosphaeriaceae sp. CCFEE 6253]